MSLTDTDIKALMMIAYWARRFLVRGGGARVTR